MTPAERDAYAAAATENERLRVELAEMEGRDKRPGPA
jgi:hypothetical protein